MKKMTILPLVAVLALGVAACTKHDDTTNSTTIESNTVVEESDANLSAVDGIDTSNSTDVLNTGESNTTANAL